MKHNKELSSKLKKSQENKQCKLCDSWYAGEYAGIICPCCNEAIIKLKIKLDKFIKEQKDIPDEFAKIIKEHFWDLI